MNNFYKNQLRDIFKDNESVLQEAINKKDFASIYLGLYELPSNSEYITSTFTELMLDLGINPLDYLDYVPAYYLYESTITEITIPKHIKRISDNAFDGSDLKHVVFEDGSNLESIEGEAFNLCHDLSIIDLPDSVLRIYSGAFRDCDRLKKIYIPSSVEYIGSGVFQGCSKNIEIFTDNNIPENVWRYPKPEFIMHDNSSRDDMRG